MNVTASTEQTVPVRGTRTWQDVLQYAPCLSSETNRIMNHNHCLIQVHRLDQNQWRIS